MTLIRVMAADVEVGDDIELPADSSTGANLATVEEVKAGEPGRVNLAVTERVHLPDGPEGVLRSRTVTLEASETVRRLMRADELPPDPLSP